MWMAGLLAGAYILLLNWLSLRLGREIKELKELIAEERKTSIWRTDEIYKRIKSTDDDIRRCRQEVDNNMAKMMENIMTEPHVKEYVGLFMKPFENKIDSIGGDVKKLLLRNKQ